MARPLLAWLEDPSTARGIRFAASGDGWDWWSYARLADLCRRAAYGLSTAGVARDDVVAIVQRSSPAFVATLFGTMLAGATASPIAPPMAFQDPAAYEDHLSGLLRSARPAVVVADDDLVDRIPGVSTIPSSALVERVGPLDVAPAGLALLQFTSGSSGRARGVRVPFAALEANVAAIRTWLEWTAQDPVASWLPVHHDMGLIGCLITPIVSRSDLWLMRPEEFIQRPLRYLRCFGRQGARLTAMPNFGLDYIVKRVPPESLDGMNFADWRAVIVGAEPLDHRSFSAFYRLLGPYGLRRGGLRPAYGLAEATLAVTGLPLSEEWTEADNDGQIVVGSGRPLTGMRIQTTDEGEIVVSGDSVAAGYANGADFADGTIHTGDGGFVRDGQLFVLGRLGDSLKVRGRAVFAEDVEAALKGAGIPGHRVAAVLGAHRGIPTVAVIFEQADVSWLQAARPVVRQRVEGARIALVDVPRGTIPRTSSGKVRRRALWQAFTQDRLSMDDPWEGG